MTEEQFDELPEEIQKRIEVLDGMVILRRSGSPEQTLWPACWRMRWTPRAAGKMTGSPCRCA
ncbi:hypothetical protein [Nocardia pseudobrasiliensis]|uniref:hypothetical protein n=1 Tax=Nocardia pseudobrasiliensis TaxID=45979 RepID=UPI000AEBF8D7|nr:hypothetical protein [Nocardia pseudobrasiliensis]